MMDVRSAIFSSAPGIAGDESGRRVPRASTDTERAQATVRVIMGTLATAYVLFIYLIGAMPEKLEIWLLGYGLGSIAVSVALLWATVGYGIRYGSAYLAIATGIALSDLAVVTYLTPFGESSRMSHGLCC